MALTNSLTRLLFLISFSSVSESFTIQAEIDIDDNIGLGKLLENDELFSDTKGGDSKKVTRLAKALLQLAPVLTVTGNISDGSHTYSISFSLETSTFMEDKNTELTEVKTQEDDEPYNYEEQEELWLEWRSSGGLLNPIVSTVEPYVIAALHLIFDGIMSSIITNVLENVCMLGDVKLV